MESLTSAACYLLSETRWYLWFYT